MPPPAADLPWRDGDQLVAPRGAALVGHCFKCGASAAGGPLAIHLHVSNPYHRRAVTGATAASLMAILDLVAYGAYAVAFLADLPAAARRPLQFSLCRRHRTQRAVLRWTAALAAAAAPPAWIAALGLPVGEDAGALLFLAGPILLWLAAFLGGMTVGPQLVAETAQSFRLAGAGQAFLAGYPEHAAN